MEIRTQVAEDDGRVIINRVQDCEPILRQAARIREKTPSKEMRHVARIPAVLVEKYLNTAGITMREFMIDPVHIERMLEDPDLRYFRTNPA